MVRPRIVFLTFISALSFCFLLLQVVVLNFMESEENVYSSSFNLLKGKINFHVSLRQEKEAHKKNALHLLKLEGLFNASSHMQLPLVLLDLRILKDLIGDITSPIRDPMHMTRCDHFCKKRGIQLGLFVKTEEDASKLNKLTAFAKETGFSVFMVDQPDKRDATLEKIYFKSIVTFIFFKWKGLLLEIVVFYKFKGRMWHNKLDSKLMDSWPGWQNLYVRQSILSNPYTNSSHLFEEITPMSFELDGIQIQVPQFMKTFVDTFGENEFIECSYGNARAFFSKYGYDVTTEAAVFREKAKNLLSVAKSVLDVMNIPFWLSSGTCLGWFRQCDFLPHGKDVDIGIWINDFNPNIAEELQNSGLLRKHIFGKIDDSYELSYQTVDKDMKLDIFFFYQEDNYMWNGGTQAKTGKKFKYIFPNFKLCWTYFMDMIVRVPCPSLPYIKANYGENWNTLVKDWDWKKSPANVHENGEWPQEGREQIIQVFN